jgi:hypothetical protein
LADVKRLGVLMTYFKYAFRYLVMGDTIFLIESPSIYKEMATYVFCLEIKQETVK